MDHDEILDVDLAEASYRMVDDEVDSHSVSASPADQLERYGRWLSSIPRDDVIALRQTPEYHDFLRTFERLGHAHRRVISVNRSAMSIMDASDHIAVIENFTPPGPLSSMPNDFLQHLTADDVILRVFEFLECHSLVRMALTCSRFRQLAYRSASQRTYDVANARQLNSVMKLLRAKEQIDGVGNAMHDIHVRVPILLLSRRVIVTDSGDPEYNGVYFCTGSNGNGFVFTKPRYPEQRVQRASTGSQNGQPTIPGGIVALPQYPEPVFHQPVGAHQPIDQGPTARLEGEVAHSGQLLRCFITKRFSNEVNLLYPFLLEHTVHLEDTNI
jgi:hypothetical protein